jgi:hypothetical protein
MKAVQFKEEDADEVAGALVPVDEGVVADDAGNVDGSHVYDFRVVSTGVELSWPGERGLKQARVAQTGSTSVQGKKTVMEREDIALANPDRLTHFESV